MNMNNQNFSLIERFFEGELDHQELSAFESKLKQDASFSKSVELYEYALQTSIKLYQPEEKDHKVVRQRWQQLRDKQKSEQAPRFSLRYISGIAAIFMILAIAGWLLLKTGGSINQQDRIVMVEDLAKSTINLDAVKSQLRTSNGENEINAAKIYVNAFEQKEYQKVIALTKDFAAIDDNHNNAILLRALAFKNLAQFDKALPLFKEIIQNKKGQIDVALWNIVAISLNQDTKDLAQAKQALQQIIDEQYPSAQEAKKVLDSL